MNCDFVYNAATSRWFKPGLIFSAALAGIGIGFAVDKVIKIVESRKTPGQTDISDQEAVPYDADREDEDEYPPIPEGVNEPKDQIKRAKDISDTFRKPSITSVIDYTKYADKAKQYDKTEMLSNLSFDDVHDMSEAPEGYSDPDYITIIEESEFVKGIGNEDGFASVTGTYFTSDKVLAGWNEDLVEKDVASNVGFRAIAMFDEPHVKAVYVRNDEKKVLYEILRSDDPMEEVVREAIKMEMD